MKAALRLVGDLITKFKKSADCVANSEALIKAKGIPPIISLLARKGEVQMMAAGVIRVLAGWTGSLFGCC